MDSANLNVFLSAAAELMKPFYKVFTNPPQQWHPLLIHFPLVFLLLEAFFILMFFITRDSHYEKLAFNFLKAGFISILIAMMAGIHDCGLNLGEGNKFLLGFQDRFKNAFRFKSSVTIHFWLAILLFIITLSRLIYCWRKGAQVLRGKGASFYGFLVVIGLWVLLAMGYVGGLLNHQ